MRALLCIFVTMSVAGCAARRPMNVSPDKPRPIDAGPRTAGQVPEDSLEAFMAKVRKLSSEAKPDRQDSAGLAARYPGLAAAAAVATFAPSPVTLRAAAEEYRRYGVRFAHQGAGDRLA